MTHPDIALTMQRLRRESIRWYLLVALNVSRPAGAGTAVLLKGLGEVVSEGDAKLAIEKQKGGTQ